MLRYCDKYVLNSGTNLHCGVATDKDYGIHIDLSNDTSDEEGGEETKEAMDDTDNDHDIHIDLSNDTDSEEGGEVTKEAMDDIDKGWNCAICGSYNVEHFNKCQKQFGKNNRFCAGTKPEQPSEESPSNTESSSATSKNSDSSIDDNINQNKKDEGIDVTGNDENGDGLEIIDVSMYDSGNTENRNENEHFGNSMTKQYTTNNDNIFNNVYSSNNNNALNINLASETQIQPNGSNPPTRKIANNHEHNNSLYQSLSSSSNNSVSNNGLPLPPQSFAKNNESGSSSVVSELPPIDTNLSSNDNINILTTNHQQTIDDDTPHNIDLIHDVEPIQSSPNIYTTNQPQGQNTISNLIPSSTAYKSPQQSVNSDVTALTVDEENHNEEEKAIILDTDQGNGLNECDIQMNQSIDVENVDDGKYVKFFVLFRIR